MDEPATARGTLGPSERVVKYLRKGSENTGEARVGAEGDREKPGLR